MTREHTNVTTFGVTTGCHDCGLSWDTEDPCPPLCEGPWEPWCRSEHTNVIPQRALVLATFVVLSGMVVGAPLFGVYVLVRSMLP